MIYTWNKSLQNESDEILYKGWWRYTTVISMLWGMMSYSAKSTDEDSCYLNRIEPIDLRSASARWAIWL